MKVSELCEQCNRRPAKSNLSLCYQCEREGKKNKHFKITQARELKQTLQNVATSLPVGAR